MNRPTAWVALVVGSVMLLACALVFAEFYRVMKPFGGIAYSWDLLRLNAYWAAASLAGGALVAAALVTLLRRRR
jgi:membrane protein implicated in regulation of membrane protease activity